MFQLGLDFGGRGNRQDLKAASAQICSVRALPAPPSARFALTNGFTLRQTFFSWAAP